MKPSPEFTRQLIEAATAAIERDMGLQGKRVEDIEPLAADPRKFRRRFYWLADYFIFAACFQVIVASYATEPAHWFALAGFCIAFPGVFFCEFRARAMTRRLKRPAAEQLARDMIGVRG